VLTYHNHDNEFYKIEGKTVLDWIYDESSPENLQGEIDTYWVQAGGGNPASWCRKLKNRLPLLHLKDFAMTKENKHVFAEIGYGTLEFPEIIREAEASGCEWFIIEQDVCPGDPFESLAKSFAYTVEHLLS
jgi:sugar phosphate isomerase/epimerase